VNLDHQNNKLIACIKCDALTTLPKISPGESAMCPCCGGTMLSKKKNPIDRTLAISLAGLLFFLPAMLLPIVGIRVAGIYNEASLIDSIVLLYQDEFYIISFFVFMFTVAIPLVRLFCAFYLSLRFKTKNYSPSLLVFFRSYHKLDTWTMIHVFFLGIVVSMYKLVTYSALTVGAGLLCLVLLLLCSTLLSVTLDQHYIWETLENELD